MLYTKSSPAGIDLVIQDYQIRLYNKLLTIWGLTSTDWDSYGRAYRNNTQSGYKAQIYESSLPGYKDLIFEDNKTIISFFNVNESTSYIFGKTINKGSMIFLMNIDKINKGVDWRPDEEIKMDIIKQTQYAIRFFPGIYGLNITGFETGYKNVLKDFEGMISNDTITYMDTYPFWNLKVNIDIFYNMF